ncbi:MAG: phosphoribosylanthranilate isomerase, partial [Clostridia bacterium]|nr:phosphoribosylanthranilate isomerase [Clostridia bacterium]
WSLVKTVDRLYFLAGGLSADNAAAAVETLHPFALDVSSGIETDGHKDRLKMAAFARAVRSCSAAIRKEEEI